MGREGEPLQSGRILRGERLARRVDDPHIRVHGPPPQWGDLGMDELALGSQGQARSQDEPMRAPEGTLGDDRPERRWADDLGRRRQLVAGEVQLRPRGPLLGDLEVDPVECAPGHVVADDGDPLREIGVDRRLALDDHGDARRPRVPRELAEPVRVVNLVRRQQARGRRRGRSAGRDDRAADPAPAGRPGRHGRRDGREAAARR